MSSSPSEPCSLSLQRDSLRLESPGTSSPVSVALPQQPLHVVQRVLGYTTLLRKIRVVLGYIAGRSLLCAQNWMTSWASFVDVLRLLYSVWVKDEVLVHESEDVITNLLEFSFHFRDVSLRVRRVLLVVLLSLLCAICSSLSAVSAADWASF